MALISSQKDIGSKPFAYEKVEQQVLNLIRQNGLNAGDRLPSEKKLATSLGVNHLTVRKGLERLVTHDIVERRVGSGTFVKSLPDSLDRQSLMGFSRAEKETLVGILCWSEVNVFVTELLEHIQQAALSLSMNTAINTIGAFNERALLTVSRMARQGVQSLIIPWLPPDVSLDQLFQFIEKSPIPVVLPRLIPGLGENCYEKPEVFGKADQAIMELAYKYLRKLGYEQVAFFGPDSVNDGTVSRRVMAYAQCTSREGTHSLISLADRSVADTDRIVQNLIQHKGSLAVICNDDEHAIRLITALHKSDMRIPEDFAVLGINNSQFGDATDPPLSTIQFAYDYLAEAMINHALALSKGESDQTPGPAPIHLLVRESCGGRARFGEQVEQVVTDLEQQLGLKTNS